MECDNRYKRGSALVMVIWLIMVLSILVMNFMVEAKLQAGINLYTKNRARVDHLTEAGKVLAENVLLTYSKVKDWTEDEDWEKLYEEDHWLNEKRILKEMGAVEFGPVPIDIRNPDSSGKVTITIGPPKSGISVGGGAASLGWNINTLYDGGNSDYRAIWSLILERCGVPEEDWDDLIDCWNDWRDENGTVSGNNGAEDEYYEDLDIPEEQKYKPRNGEIMDLKELAMIRGFRDHPAILTGGDYDEEPEADDGKKSSRRRRKKDKDARIVKSILPYFSVIGNGKINVNLASKELLMTVPGIANVDDPEDPEAEEIAEVIVETREYQKDENGNDIRDDEDYGPFKDWNSLVKRTSQEINSAANKHLCYGTEQDDQLYFEISITGESGNITHTVRAIAVVQNEKVRYIRWIED